MLVGIHDRIRIERIDPEHGETLVREPSRIIDGGFSIDPRNLLPKDVLRPFNLLLDSDLEHIVDEFFIVDVRKFSSYFFYDVRKKCHMCEFISTDIRDHTSCRRHLHMIDECIEKGKSIIEIETLEEEIRDDTAKEIMIGRSIDKILINASDIGISIEQDLIGPPEVVYILSLLSTHDCLEYRRIALRVYRLLICLYRENEVHFWTRNIVREIREIHRLDRVEKDEK